MDKVAELTGAELDYWVARAEGYKPFFTKLTEQGNRICTISVQGDYGGELARFYRPSTDWAQGGPLIERHAHMLHHFELEQSGWLASAGSPKVGKAQGDTPLVAICRAFVRSVFGDEVVE